MATPCHTRAQRLARLAVSLGLASACTRPPPPRNSTAPPPTSTETVPASCPRFSVEQTGMCADSALSETSGIAASTVLPGALWAHNDSGDNARLFAIGRDGTLHGEVTLEGAHAIDWEDMSAAPGTLGSPRDLLVGDVGDNFRKRDRVHLYRLAEPGMEDVGGRVPVRRIEVRLKRGPADVEALFVDPVDGSIYLVSKTLLGAGTLYRVALPPDSRALEASVDAEPVGSVPMKLVTAADMTNDGSRLVVRNYTSALLWQRPEGMSIADLVQQPPCPLELPREPQGEAIAFADSHTLILLSEQPEQPVYVLSEHVTDSIALH